jgi:hypothetical protein
MQAFNNCDHAGNDRSGRLTIVARSIAGAMILLGSAGVARAVDIPTGNPDLKIRFDNTIKYSAAWRVKSLDERVAAPGGNYAAANPNLDDGDRNFGKGLISNRVDLLSEFDVAYQDFGARLSGAAWYDDVYNSRNDNPGLPTLNSASVGAGQFTDATRRLHGRKAELLDAFVYGKFGLGDLPLTVRAGRYNLLYGETLYIGGNGFSNAQVPIDVIKALSVPNVQFKEIGMPVGQVSGNLQLAAGVSVGAYYQYEWRKYRLPASGSYFSFADFLDSGGERLLVGPGVAFTRSRDLTARNSGQGGVQIKFKLPGSETEFGLYAAQYHDKVPLLQLRPASGTYQLVYPEGIKTYAASFSTLFGETNVSGEISVRRNTPLAPLGGAVVALDPRADNAGNPAYATGNSMHANTSFITLLPANSLWQGAQLVGELAFNRRTSITRNAAAMDPNTTRDAWATKLVFEPSYFQVLPGIDMTVPLGLGYQLSGRSSVFQYAPEHGGDVSIGVNADYQKTWRASLQYTHYLGRAGAVLSGQGLPGQPLSFDQVLKDRNFVSFAVQRSF